MDIKTLLKNPPQLHTNGKGNSVSWQLEDDVLNFIYENVNAKSKTLETGAGLSTIVFALSKAKHTCIVPDRREVLKIKNFCKENKISTKNITFIVNGSEKALPKLNKKNLDLVLIDGRHGFPSPFIDWYYATPMIGLGGLVIIDDVPLWTGRVLKDFLSAEPEWSLKKNLAKTVVFVKEKEGSHNREWLRQPYILQQSLWGVRKEAVRQSINLMKNGKSSFLFSQIAQKLGIG